MYEDMKWLELLYERSIRVPHCKLTALIECLTVLREHPNAI